MIQNGIEFRYAKLNQNGKQRLITIYSPKDINIQQRLLRQITPLLKRKIHPAACGYIAGKSCLSTAIEIQKQILPYRFFVKSDISSFFPSIHRPSLSERIHALLPNDIAMRVLAYATCCDNGISQGSPLSPILSNLYLYDVDCAMACLPKSQYYRYADDILLLTNLPQPAMLALQNAMHSALLAINPKKTVQGRIDHPIAYLGFEISQERLMISHTNQNEFVLRLSQAKHEQRRAMIQGFQAYYQREAYLHPSLDLLYWMTRYAAPSRVEKYFKSFPDDMKQVVFAQTRHRPGA